MSAAPTTHRAENELGEPVTAAGEVRWLSGSAVVKADPNSEGGCPRRFWYHYRGSLLGISKREPETAAMKAGTAEHAQIETYLRTGEMVLGPAAMAGKRFIDAPGPGLFVEEPIILGGHGKIDKVWLRIAGVPYAGHLDLYNLRGKYLDADGGLREDKANTLEVKDWKCLPAGVMIFDPLAARRHDVSEPGELHVDSWAGVSDRAVVGAPGARSTARAAAFPSGSKSCVTAHLNDGTDLRASEDHPVYTKRGWVAAGKLEPQDHVAVAASAPEPERPTVASDAEVVLVAYLLSDGGCTGESMRFTNMTPGVIAEFLAAASALGYVPRENKQRSKARDWTLSRRPGGRGPRSPDHVRARWGLFGLSKEKRAHADVWGLPSHQVALFLNRFWACDGYVGGHQVAVELASEKLIDDLRFLLLRLGIRSQKHKRKTRKLFTSWILTLGGSRALRFLDVVGDVLGKEKACARLRAFLKARPRRGHNNTAGDGLEWVRVKTVTSTGEQPVFDVSVPGSECFIADGVLVHNTTSNLRWARNPEQVGNAIQMTGYAMAGFAKWPRFERARLTHVYFQRNGRPQATLSTVLRARSQIERRWEYASSIARSIIDIAREDDPRKVPAVVKSCRAYNQPCPHLDYCGEGKSAQTRNGLESIFGPRLAALLTGDAANAIKQSKDTMGLLKADIASDTISLDDLVNEEAALRDEVAAVKPLPATREFARAIVDIVASAWGMVAMAGEAARMYNTLNDKPDLGAPVVGSGRLAKLAPMIEPGQVIDLASQLNAKIKAAAPTPAPTPEPTPAPIALLPPDAPASSLLLAADPVAGLDTPRARDLASAIANTATPAPTPAPTPETELAAAKAELSALTDNGRARVVAGSEAASEVSKAEAPKPRRGRPPGPAKSTTAINIYLDVAIEGLDAQSLEPYVAAVSKPLLELWNCGDVRLAGNDTAGGYNKGVVVLSTLCVATPPEPGVYVLDTRGNPVHEAVAVALRQTCIDSGGAFVRGIR